VLAFLRDALGYAHLGHWKDRPDNANVEEARLTDWLKRQGHGDKIIGRVIGFEKLNFSISESDSLHVALETTPG
jgi:hypothetical protein